MKGFQVAPVQNSCELDAFGNVNGQGEMREIKVESIPSRPEKETARERFQRVARTVLLQSTAHRWNVVLKAHVRPELPDGPVDAQALYEIPHPCLLLFALPV